MSVDLARTCLKSLSQRLVFVNQFHSCLQGSYSVVAGGDDVDGAPALEVGLVQVVEEFQNLPEIDRAENQVGVGIFVVFIEMDLVQFVVHVEDGQGFGQAFLGH